jgi:hypothetical protein
MNLDGTFATSQDCRHTTEQEYSQAREHGSQEDEAGKHGDEMYLWLIGIQNAVNVTRRL